MPGSSPGMTSDRAGSCFQLHRTRMQHRAISRTQRAQRRGRRQQHRIVDCAVCLADNRPSTIAAPCPARSESSPRPPAPSRHRAIAPPASAADAAASCRAPAARRCSTASISRARMSVTPLPSSHAARKRLASSRRQKKQGRWPAANAVASSRKNSSVQLRRAHHLAPPAPELADAGDPGRARPALFQQRLGRGIMDDAAVAGEQAAMRSGDDVAGGRDAVLQGHAGCRATRRHSGTVRSIEPGISRFRVRCFASPRNDAYHTAPSRPDRRLERQRGIPGKMDPGVLRHFGDEGIDQRLALAAWRRRWRNAHPAASGAPAARSRRCRRGRRRSTAPCRCRRRAWRRRPTHP